MFELAGTKIIPLFYEYRLGNIHRKKFGIQSSKHHNRFSPEAGNVDLPCMH